MHTDTFTTTGYYLQIRLLPEECRPAFVVRHKGVTLVAVDPRSTKGEVACWAPDHLTAEEMNLSRTAYSQGPVGTPLEDEWMGSDFFPIDVPESIQLRPFVRHSG